MKNTLYISLIGLLLIITACGEDEPQPQPIDNINEHSLTDIPYNPVTYEIPRPNPAAVPFPNPIIPTDNPMTVDGVELGRRLFYDPILSGDSTMACAGCHAQSKSFTDSIALSIGIDGVSGIRNSMPLINLAYNNKGFNWDGLAQTLEEQALEPVENVVELHATWGNVEDKLKRYNGYPTYFRKAFGIETKGEITRTLATKALAQFIRTLVSFQSKYDRSLGVVPGNRPILTASELRGQILMTRETGDLNQDKECTHCHGGTLYTDNTYRNNGLDNAPTLHDFTDLGRGGVTGNQFENGQFRVPTLRNIVLTAPYMHDGRFATLEEVLDHYAAHVQLAENLDVNLAARITANPPAPISFTDQEKQDIINFLHTLTDTAFVNNPAFSNPWQ